MDTQTQAVYDAALLLAESQRALLVRRLLATLSEEIQEISDEDLLAELDRRRLEWEQGKAGAVRWAELREQE